MVATRRNNPGAFAQPVTLSVGGEDKVFTSADAVFDYLRTLERVASALHIDEARAVFNLGRALMQAKEKLGYGHINHLYNECGINSRRAQRAIRFANHLAGGDGLFCIERFRKWERKVLDMRDAGEIRCELDAQGTPSVTGMQKGMGIRSAPKPKNEHVFAFDERAETAQNDPRVASGTPYRSASDALAALRPPAGPISAAADAPRGAGGGQLAIDFDLIAAERRLATLVGQAQDAMVNGTLSGDDAGRIHDALERVCDSTQSILIHAKG